MDGPWKAFKLFSIISLEQFIEAIPLEDRECFKTWSLHLLGCVDIDMASLQSIAYVLLLHYRNTLQYLPGHRLNARMVECMRECSFGEEKLFHWSDAVRARFSIENAIYLPLDDLGEDGVVPMQDIHEYMLSSQKKLDGNSSDIRRMSIEVNDLKGE